jgi:hypothetical protein
MYEQNQKQLKNHETTRVIGIPDAPAGAIGRSFGSDDCVSSKEATSVRELAEQVRDRARALAAHAGTILQISKAADGNAKELPASNSPGLDGTLKDARSALIEAGAILGDLGAFLLS